MHDRKTPQDCTELLQRMVQIDSVNEHHSGRQFPERELAEYLEWVCARWGLASRRVPLPKSEAYNLLVEVKGNSDAPVLLMESHMDTVGIDGMKSPALGGEIRDRRLWGRGACDTKATGAAMLTALREYANLAHRPNDVALLFVVDEEALKTGIKSFIEHDLAGLRTLPAGAIVGEPTGMNPVVAHCGVSRFRIRTHGTAAHSSNPGLGKSAISMMVRVIDELEHGYIPGLDASHPLTGDAQCSINVIRGGTAVNIVPDTCDIWIDRRVVPGENPNDVVPAINAILDGLGSSDPELSCSIEDIRTDPPLDPVGSEKFIDTVCDALAKCGCPSTPLGVGYGSDGSTIDAAGIPVVLFGPGDIAQAHAEVEYVDLDELFRSVGVYLRIMESDLGNSI